MATKKKVAKKKVTRRVSKKAGERSTEPARHVAVDETLRDESVYETGLKQEADDGPEETMPGRFYRPATDIYETGDALILVTDVPGVSLEGLSVHVDRDILSIHALVEVGNYEGLSPLYTEYNVGHFTRRFRLPGSVDPDGIDAKLSDGVLVLELAKAAAYRKRRIPVG